MRVIVFRHVAFEHLGLVAGALARFAIEPVYVDLPQDPVAEVSLADAAGVIFMGGPMSVNDGDAWLHRELQFAAQAIADRKPTLGICLGAQLIAKALGARVYSNATKEIGWFPLQFTPACAADPLFTGIGPRETLFQWHGETFDLPPGAELLASTEACRNQAFRVRDHVYALQFHLEVTPEMIADWCEQDANCGDVRELSAPINPFAHAERQRAVAAVVFDRWCAMVRAAWAPPGPKGNES